MSPRRLPGAVTASLVALALAVVLGGCFTGKRPSFADDEFGHGRLTGDPAIDAVLTKLDTATTSPPTFTATYAVVVRFGNLDKTIDVAVDGRSRSITVGDVRYLQTPSLIETCRGASCSTGLDAAAISDTQLTTDFYAANSAKRLRLDAVAKIGPTVARTEQIAGQTANCVDIAQATGTAAYCVLDDGILAKLTDGDVYLTMTSFTPTVDPQAFAVTPTTTASTGPPLTETPTTTA